MSDDEERDPLDELLVAGTTGPVCEWCSGRWTFATADRAGAWTPPAGHTVHTTPDGSNYDTCPQEGTLHVPWGDAPFHL